MRWAQLAALALVAVVAVAVAAAVPGPNGAILNHALLPLGGAMDVNRAAAGLDCAESSSSYNYDAAALGLADEAAVTTWANTGSFGSGWNADTLVSAGGSITYQQAGDCLGGGGPCVAFDDDVLRMTGVDTGQTWTTTIQCAVIAAPDPYTGLQRVHGWTNIGGTHNMLQFASTTASFIYDTNSISVAQTVGQVSAICWDATDFTSVTASVNGDAPTAAVDSSGVSARDPYQIYLGGAAAGTRADGHQIFQVLGWSEDPGQTVQELSACLAEKWGSL